MKTVTLMRDHVRWVNGKEVRYKAGETIEVSDREFNQITEAVRQYRITMRKVAEGIPGTPEWKAKRDQ